MWLKGIGVVAVILIIWTFKADQQTRMFVTFGIIAMLAFYAVNRNKR